MPKEINLGKQASGYIKSVPNALANATSDLLSSSDFIHRSIGMANSYEDIMIIVQALGREPISLLGKDYLYIFDHVRRNYNMGSNVMNQYHNDCPKFTFYKEKPTVRFANPYDDPKNLLDRWMPNVNFQSTSQRNVLFSYAESNDDSANGREIGTSYGIENANPGVNFGGISSFANVLTSCDIIKKTNDNFNHGKYKTLIARFHTNSMDSKDADDITQTAVSNKYGMSHGRNLLRRYSQDHSDNGYDNPYCRVWTYHHQYNQLARAIRPFDLQSAEMLEKGELSGEYKTVGFRTIENEDFGFKGGSERLDKYGVLNYRNGMVNISPTAKIKDYFEGKQDKEVTIKKCMFSIENLAWKTENIKMDEYDQYGLSAEQKGPLGGRIMWFPPYDLTFNESVRVNWNSNQFIGRGEKVYTYTDTERTGNLSFTLLIDHPSILDYWTGHKRNGMKNQGVSLIPGNGGGVDEINNQENTLLRFFTGCEILSAKPQEYRQRQLKKEEVEDPEIITNVQNPDECGPEGKKTIYCVLYFPNNYSGVDDAPTTSNKVNAIYYLMNGIGAQKCVDENTLDEVDIPLTSIDNKVKVDGFDGIGGYEAGSAYGISIETKNLNENHEQISKTYADLETNEKKAQYLTSPDGSTKLVAKYGDNSYTLAKMVNKKFALPLSQAYGDKLSGERHEWYGRRWYYRVDNVYSEQRLDEVESYLDVNPYGLNTKIGYLDIENNNGAMRKVFGLTEEENSTLVSFADMFVALEGEKAEKLFDDSKIDRNNVEIVRELKNENSGIKILSVKFNGHASFQGKNEFNEKLARNRAETFKGWLKGHLPNIGDAKVEFKPATQQDNINVGYNNDETVKMWRSASVIIEYQKTDIEHASLANSSVADDAQGNKMNKVDKISDVKYYTAREWLDNSEEGKKLKAKYGTTDQIIGMNPDMTIQYGAIDPWTFTMQDANRLSGKNYTDPKSWDFDNSWLQTNLTNITKGTVERYDNEGEFFELLEKNDPFMHHLITEKIRYFDPAFHSISPEGFNARLTFLHQCTRQGSTVGGSDSQIGNTAYNLAFGRPPVCVLRLGDFYYTKIIINSVNIQYEQPQWDLNPEGIGVMPMFAKITLDFVFLGGSDLAGPISRLQNAVSFNYYANTSVYDNRAEMVQYDSDGNGREVKFKAFSYPDMIHNGGIPKKPQIKTKSNDVKKVDNVSNLNSVIQSEKIEETKLDESVKPKNNQINKQNLDKSPQKTLTKMKTPG